jgi:hypothetical protein
MIKKFIKTNFLIVFLAVAALVTALPAPVDNFPGDTYISPICLIFCFMVAAAGLEEGGIYLLIHGRMRSKLSPGAAYFSILIFSFILSAILSPYAVLILGVPLITRLFDSKTVFFLIPLTAAACDLGGFLSPVSTFQNGFLTFSAGVLPEQIFFTLLPYSLIGFGVIAAASAPIPKIYSAYEGLREIRPEPVYISVFVILLIITALAVGSVFNSIAAFVSLCLVVVILEPKLVRKPLYSVILMLFLLSVTAWNITRANLIALPEDPFFAVIALSNIITAENAAVYLHQSGISGELLTVAVNIGAAGFVFSSPVTLMAYGYAVSIENAKPVRSLLFFAAQGIIITAILSAVYFVLPW